MFWANDSNETISRGDNVRGDAESTRTASAMTPMQSNFGTRSKRGWPLRSVLRIFRTGSCGPPLRASMADAPRRRTRPGNQRLDGAGIRRGHSRCRSRIESWYRSGSLSSERRGFCPAPTGRQWWNRADFRVRQRASSIRNSASTIMLSDPPTSSRTLLPAPWPTVLRAATTRCSSMAAWAWEKPI